MQRRDDKTFNLQNRKFIKFEEKENKFLETLDQQKL